MAILNTNNHQVLSPSQTLLNEGFVLVGPKALVLFSCLTTQLALHDIIARVIVLKYKLDLPVYQVTSLPQVPYHRSHVPPNPSLYLPVWPASASSPISELSHTGFLSVLKLAQLLAVGPLHILAYLPGISFTPFFT